MYQWIVFVHVASILAFMLAHGVHATAMWAMYREPDPERMLTFFNDVPNTGILRLSLGVVVLSGVLAGFMGSWWGAGWIWASILLLAFISITMWLWGGTYYGMLQEAAESAVAARTKDQDVGTPQSVYDTTRRNWRVTATSVVGLGGIAVILWLMMFKPF